jgi:hypothetical protein
MVSVIIAWKARPELKRTLDANAPMLARHAVEVVIVNCGGGRGELESLVGQRGALDVRYVHLPSPAFNRSLANNIGAMCASHSWLFFLDADVILKSDIFSLVETGHDSRSFITIRKVFESKPGPVDPMLSFLKERINTHEYICKDGRRASTQDVNGSDGSRCGPGLLLVSKEHFLAAGGFNSALTGWGFEDVDLHLRLQFTAGLTPILSGEVVHLSHPPSHPTFRETNLKNVLQCFENYRHGRFLGTYHEDVQRWGPSVADARRSAPAATASHG